MLNGSAQLYRFAAADAAPLSRKARAISWVLAGGVAAGLVGPPLGAAVKDVIPAARFAGSYAVMLVLYAVVLAILWRLRLAPPVEEEARRPPRPLGEIARQPTFLAAVAMAMTAYGIMALVMTATPLSMQAEDFAFEQSAFVIQAHVVAMFAPSFVTGRLIMRFGLDRIATVGLAAFATCIGIALAGSSLAHFWIALVFLGIGWNFLFVSGSTLLTQTHRTAERGKVQGVNDLVVFGTAAAASLAAGHVQHTVGWHQLHVGLAPVLVLVAGGLAVLGLLVRVRATPDAGRPVA
jgi:MFS family permease